MEAVFSRGMRGDLVERLQQALTGIQVTKEGEGGGHEPALTKVDGDFGKGTTRAIQRVQAEWALPKTGVVDRALWVRITGTPWPDRFERQLSLLASFEGHGYTLAAGNWDNAGVTWGVIGFTLLTRKTVDKKKVLVYGSLHTLLVSAFQRYPTVVERALGKERSDKLKEKLAESPDKLYAFAVEITDSVKPTRLDQDWQLAFAKLGAEPDIRALQRELAKTLYYDPAIAAASEFATEFDMASELTDQLFFDIQVNNGGLGSSEAGAKEAVRALIAAKPAATLNEKLLAITAVVAKDRPKFSKDILERKGAISNGFGTVHQKDYRLDGWGISIEPDLPPAPLPVQPPILLHDAVLGFDPTEQAEQLQLAVAAAGLGLVNTGVELSKRGLWPSGCGIECISDKPNGPASMSLKSLLGAAGDRMVKDGGEALLHGLNLMFRKRVGLLALMGQTTPLHAELTGEHLLVGRADRDYIGLTLQLSDQLHIVRQRRRGQKSADVRLDVTELRTRLGDCRMLMLYAGYGVPYEESAAGKPPLALQGSGVRWREWLAPTGASPIVLGWYGNVRLPRDAARQFVTQDFMSRIKLLEPGADLPTLYERHATAIVQCWGQACHAAFHDGAQRYLWLDPGIAGLGLTKCGSAAIGADGRIWHANSEFGQAGKPAMKEA